MSSSAVQFWGMEAVVKAYECKDVAAWSVWCGKSLNHCYEGDDVGEGKQLLQTYLQLMGSSTNAIYTLKVHRELKDGEYINEKTLCNGSFNFRLNSEGQMITHSQYTSMHSRQEFDDRLKRIEDLLSADDDDDETEEDTFDKVERILEKPVIAGILNKWLGTNIGSAGGATMGGIHNEQELQDALKILRQHDPHLSRHMKLLSMIALQDPGQFKMLMGMLDNMKFKNP